MTTMNREEQKQVLIDTANHIIHRDNTSPYSENLRELARIALAALEVEPVAVNDDMAYAFHHALSDSSPGADEVEEIKAGLRAAFANVTAQPASVVPEAEPVAWTDEEELRDVKRYGLGEIFQYPPDKSADSRRVIPLYRVPPASIVQAQGIEIAINELVALSPRLDKRAAETLSMAVAQLRKLVKKQLQAKD
ncbi:hypothetical protein ACQ8CQ_003437 [Escherichia coli]